MPITEIEQILNKYKRDELKIEHLLNLQQDEVVPTEVNPRQSNTISIEEVVARNKQILKDLEIAKANLRSKAIFSPSEMQWQKIYQNYNQCPSMPVTTYKCQKAVFV